MVSTKIGPISQGRDQSPSIDTPHPLLTRSIYRVIRTLRLVLTAHAVVPGRHAAAACRPSATAVGNATRPVSCRGAHFYGSKPFLVVSSVWLASEMRCRWARLVPATCRPNFEPEENTRWSPSPRPPPAVVQHPPFMANPHEENMFLPKESLARSTTQCGSTSCRWAAFLS